MFDYTSRVWRDLITFIKQQRLNDEGFIICEYCHKPIIKAYDCIGHHSVVLDETNCNNPDIALNPDLIQLVHHRCHNIIHNKLGIGQKQVFLVYGAPLSGKSAYVKEKMNVGDLVIDIDSIWQCLSGCEKYIKPNRLKQNVFAMRDTLLDMVRVRRGNWLNAYIIGGYPLISERERLIKSLGAREIFIDTPRSECMERLIINSEGRSIDEWTKYIDDWFLLYSPRGFA